MKKLKNRDLISVNNETGNIELTDNGYKIAKEMYDRHNILSTILMKLGVPANIARQDACKIEHDLSDETFNAIKEHFLKH